MKSWSYLKNNSWFSFIFEWITKSIKRIYAVIKKLIVMPFENAWHASIRDWFITSANLFKMIFLFCFHNSLLGTETRYSNFKRYHLHTQTKKRATLSSISVISPLARFREYFTDIIYDNLSILSHHSNIHLYYVCQSV